MRARGFTLVEVLVALVIVAAGAAAVLSSLNTAAASAVYLREKTFAQWVADNRITETRLTTTAPANGTTEGEVDFANQRWRWRQQIQNSELPGVRRIDVSVRAVSPAGANPGGAAANAGGEDSWTVTVSGALGRDLAGPGAPIDWAGQPGAGGDGAEGAGAAGDSAGGSSGSEGGQNGGAGGDGSGSKP